MEEPKQYSFTFEDDDIDYTKRKPKQDDISYKVKKLDDRKEKLEQNHEIHREFDEFLNTYSKAYEYKLITSSSEILINEIMNILKEVSKMNEPLIDTTREDKVKERFCDYPGWISYSVKQNICTREKCKILFNVLNKKYTNSIVSFLDFVHKDTKIDEVKNIIESKLKEHGITLHRIQFNMGYVFERFTKIDIEPKKIINACVDCRQSIKDIIEITHNLEIVLRIFSWIQLENLRKELNG